MTLSEKLFTLRKKSGMNQEELAEKLDVSRQAISKWENGESFPEITKLKAIADIFSVTADFLLDDTKDEFIRAQFTENSEKKTALDRIFDRADELFGKLRIPLGLLSIIYGVYQIVIMVIFFVNMFTPLPAFATGVVTGAGIALGAGLILPLIKAVIFIIIGVMLIKKRKQI